MASLYPYTGPQASQPNQLQDQSSPLEELLLASGGKGVDSLEESQQVFDFYITPYTDKEGQGGSKPDTTMLKMRKEGSTQLFRREEEEIDRLKAIISKKNEIIGQLTEQIRNLAAEVHDLKQKQHPSKKSTSRTNPYTATQSKKELHFLQQNNTQLFQELQKAKQENDQLSAALRKITTQTLPALQLHIDTLQKENRQLQLENWGLMKDIKRHIQSSKKEIKYVNKMKDILSQKGGLKESTFDLGLTKSTQLGHRARSEEQLGKFKHSSSVRQQPRKERGAKCMSIGTLKKVLV